MLTPVFENGVLHRLGSSPVLLENARVFSNPENGLLAGVRRYVCKVEALLSIGRAYAAEEQDQGRGQS